MGRPRIYDNPDELESNCDKYFEEETKPTVTGLALYLGFASKQSLYDYQENESFSYPIKKALTRIENYHEKRLSDNNVTGAIFALKNMGWKDKVEQDVNMNASVNWNEQKTYEANSKANEGS